MPQGIRDINDDGRQPKPPTTGSGVKPPPPPVDRMWSLGWKPNEIRAFNSDGDEVFSAYWQPTGHYRICVGWFGIPRVEQQMVFRHSDDGGFSTLTEWRKAPRGTIVRFLRPVGAGGTTDG